MIVLIFGGAQPVVRVRLHHHPLALDPLHELERAGPDRLLPERVVPPTDSKYFFGITGRMLSRPSSVASGCFSTKSTVSASTALTSPIACEGRGVARVGLRVEQAVVGEGDVLGGHRVAVVELDALADLEAAASSRPGSDQAVARCGLTLPFGSRNTSGSAMWIGRVEVGQRLLHVRVERRDRKLLDHRDLTRGGAAAGSPRRLAAAWVGAARGGRLRRDRRGDRRERRSEQQRGLAASAAAVRLRGRPARRSRRLLAAGDAQRQPARASSGAELKESSPRRAVGASCHGRVRSSGSPPAGDRAGAAWPASPRFDGQLLDVAGRGCRAGCRRSG